jgi:DNA-binding transcriptional MocR family regulator
MIGGMTHLPDIQMQLRPGYVEFAWGHPDPALIPSAELGHAAARALERDGWTALAYGAAQGPGRLIAPLAAHLTQIDGSPADPATILVTAGISHALDLACTLLTQPGDIALVEAPVYHFALQILRDHGLRLIPVAADGDGIRLDALEQRFGELRRAGEMPRLLYTVPTYNNPSGSLLTHERRRRLVELAGAHDLTVLEDDVYRELWFDTPPPPPLFGYGGSRHVIRLGSFSKIIAPGLRLGWLMADPALVARATRRGLLTSGGGINHFTAHVVAAYLDDGALDRHVAELRAAYRARRDALVAALRAHLPPGCSFVTPRGGFFVWVQTPEGIDSAALLRTAAGVGFVPGAHFYPDNAGRRELRLAFSLLQPDELVEGARRLGQAITAAPRAAR